MSINWDIAAFDRKNRFVLAVVVKAIFQVSEAWADSYRQNILEDLEEFEEFEVAPYFLLACPDRFFLWKQGTNGAPRPFMADPSGILNRYFTKSDFTVEQLDSDSLGLLVTSWLNGVMFKPANQFDPFEQWVIDSGLYSALAGGHLEHEVAA